MSYLSHGVSVAKIRVAIDPTERSSLYVFLKRP